MRKPRFSIRYKFLAVTTALLILCVGGYLFLATSEYKNDKKTLVFDYNQSLVGSLSADIDSYFVSLTERMRMVAYFFRETEKNKKMFIADLLQSRGDVVWMIGSERFEKIDHEFYVDKNYFSTYGLDETEAREWLAKQKIPLQELQVTGEFVWAPAGDLPLLAYGRTIVEENQNGVPVRQMAVIGFVKADRFIKFIEQGRPNEVVIVKASGEPLLGLAANGADAALLKLAQQSKVKRQVLEFSTPGDQAAGGNPGEQYLAAFSQALGGQVFVLSKIAEAKAFRAVDRLVFRSLLIASMIVTLAFIVAIFFSRSLTRPLDVMLKGMRKVSDGDLQTQIVVHSRDEMAVLANSFNRMIEDLKKSREELENINRELEDKVRARTMELEMQNQAVKEAQEALLRTTRLAAVGEVAGQAAHEVLNPLTSIVSRLQKLKKRVGEDRKSEVEVLEQIQTAWHKDYKEGGLPKLMQSWQSASSVNPGQKLWDEDLENITAVTKVVQNEFQNLIDDTDFLLEETERIQRIVNSFRGLSTSRGELVPVAVNEICEKSVRIMADLAQKDKIKIEKSFLALPDTVLADSDEFLQVMTNLIRNALQSVKTKHGETGKGWLKISTVVADDFVEVRIQDNGMGVNPANKSRLFEKNFTTKSKAEGTGIGLSISRRLIRAFRGDLLLEDEASATFVIRLPVYVAGESQHTDGQNTSGGQTTRGVA